MSFVKSQGEKSRANNNSFRLVDFYVDQTGELVDNFQFLQACFQGGLSPMLGWFVISVWVVCHHVRVVCNQCQGGLSSVLLLRQFVIMLGWPLITERVVCCNTLSNESCVHVHEKITTTTTKTKTGRKLTVQTYDYIHKS